MNTFCFFVALLLVGCASAGHEANAVSAPVSTDTSLCYAALPDALHGSLRLESAGAVVIQSVANDAARVRAVHVRAVVTNNDKRGWMFDVREQRIELRAHGQSGPAFSASAGVPPELAIAPHHVETIDLFFTLPADLQTGATIPSFEVIWWLDIGESVLVQHAPFTSLARLDLDAWSPPYSYNLFQEDFAFPGSAELAHDIVGRPITIRSDATVHIAEP